MGRNFESVRRTGIRVTIAAMWLLSHAAACPAQTAPAREAPAAAATSVQAADDLIDRPVASVTLDGLKTVPRQEVLNNIRTAAGDPFDLETVKADVSRLSRLGKFKNIDAIGQLQSDGSVLVLFRFIEQQLINEVQVVGNKLIADADLTAVVRQFTGSPRDDFQIKSAKKAIEDMYRKRGHYLTSVSIDEAELEKSGLLIFKVIEGPRVRIRAIDFEGNHAFTDDQLNAEIKTSTAILLFRKGELDENILADDVSTLDRFYRDRGYIDVRVDSRIDLSPDNTEAKVTFVFAEGVPYTLGKVQATTLEGKPLKVFAPEQIAAIMELKTGDVYSYDKLKKSVKAVQDAYGMMGYLDVQVRHSPVRTPDNTQVDLLLEIDEGAQYSVDVITVSGNFLTRDKVIRGPLRLSPGRLFDATELERGKDRLDRMRLFNDTRITVQKEDPAGSGMRDVLVEIKEKNTGSVNFGVAVGSDSGLFGELSLKQDNFDVTDTPESIEELFSGRAFRGGGQKFNATLRPGTDLFQYSMSLTEPQLMDTNYSGTAGFQFRQRYYDQYDETRYGGTLSVGRAFGDIWAASVNTRLEEVRLDNIDPHSPTEYFEDAGPDFLSTLGMSLTRTTIETYRRPGKGSRLEMSFDQFGVLGGDFDFSSINAEYTVYFTVAEDFLGRRDTIKLVSKAGYIFGGRAPTYERFYLGGRSFRGFEYRTISPKGVANDTGRPTNDPVGGEWELFFGAQYEKPLFADSVTGVVFVDTGTVTDEVGFNDYRVSVGVGIRLYIPQFGDIPIAFDFGIPLIDREGDEEQLLTFSAELPF